MVNDFRHDGLLLAVDNVCISMDLENIEGPLRP